MGVSDLDGWCSAKLVKCLLRSFLYGCHNIVLTLKGLSDYNGYEGYIMNVRGRNNYELAFANTWPYWKHTAFPEFLKGISLPIRKF